MVTMRPKETLALNPAAPPTRRTHRNVGSYRQLGSPGVMLMTLLSISLREWTPDGAARFTDKLAVA